MARVAPFHTVNEEDGAGHRNVYHDQSECHYGKKILAKDRVSGNGNRPRCDECKRLG